MALRQTKNDVPRGANFDSGRELGLTQVGNILDLCVAKSEAVASLRCSLPRKWPATVVQLLEVARQLVGDRGSIDMMRLVAADLALEIDSQTGHRLELRTFLLDLIRTLDAAHGPALRGALTRIVRDHLQNMPTDDLVEQVCANRLAHYVESHLDGKLTASMLARVSGLPSHYLSTLFKRQVGLPLHRYVAGARMRRAIELLRRQQKVLSVMAEVGYHNKTSFNQTFKRLTGVTPRAFKAGAANGFDLDGPNG